MQALFSLDAMSAIMIELACSLRTQHHTLKLLFVYPLRALVFQGAACGKWRVRSGDLWTAHLRSHSAGGVTLEVEKGRLGNLITQAAGLGAMWAECLRFAVVCCVRICWCCLRILLLIWGQS